MLLCTNDARAYGEVYIVIVFSYVLVKTFVNLHVYTFFFNDEKYCLHPSLILVFRKNFSNSLWRTDGIPEVD